MTSLAFASTLCLGACGTNADSADESFLSSNRRPEVLPIMLNKELPFRYPPALYAQKTQGNVMLRIYVDDNGRVTADSTRVVETSGLSALDSAAVKGSRELRFVPAKTRGEPLAVTILFPVYFRHPDAPPLPGDTVLKRAQPKP